MKASDLIGAQVFDREGEKLGRLFDIEASRTGPLVSEAEGNALQISGLLVGSRAFLLRLGFGRSNIKGPYGFGWFARKAPGYRVRWEDIAAIEGDRILLGRVRSELAPLR